MTGGFANDELAYRHAAELARLSRQLQAQREGAELPLGPAVAGPVASVADDRGTPGSLEEGVQPGSRRGSEPSVAPAGARRPARQPPTPRARPTASRTATSGAAHARSANADGLAVVLPFRRADATPRQEPGATRAAGGGAVEARRGHRSSEGGREARRAATNGAAEETLAAELAADPEEVARGLCLRWLAGRPHTRAELARRLARQGVALPATNRVLDRYSDVGLIDDAAFALAWVEGRRARRGLGRRALAVELRSRGVDPATVDAAVNRLTPAEEESAARALVTRKLAVLGGVSAQVRARRLMGLLARRGYAGDLASRIVREALAGPDAAPCEPYEAPFEPDPAPLDSDPD